MRVKVKKLFSISVNSRARNPINGESNSNTSLLPKWTAGPVNLPAIQYKDKNNPHHLNHYKDNAPSTPLELSKSSAKFCHLAVVFQKEFKNCQFHFCCYCHAKTTTTKELLKVFHLKWSQRKSSLLPHGAFTVSFSYDEVVFVTRQYHVTGGKKIHLFNRISGQHKAEKKSSISAGAKKRRRRRAKNHKI